MIWVAIIDNSSNLLYMLKEFVLEKRITCDLKINKLDLPHHYGNSFDKKSMKKLELYFTIEFIYVAII